MDLVLKFLDDLFFDQMYQTLSLPSTTLANERDDVARQSISVFLIVAIGGALLYFSCSGLSWFLLFDKEYMNHPKILKNQVRREILTTVTSIPFMTLLTVPIFVAEVRGYSKLHDQWGSWASEAFTIFCFLAFTDGCIYWIHRFLHHPWVYPTIHKTHHLWKVPTPWASHAFHPVDGFLQSVPYHLYVFLFPMNKALKTSGPAGKVLYLAMFVGVNMWTISIHDGCFLSYDGIINSSAHHAEHHLRFSCNYGQYFTVWDRLFGTHVYPDHAALDPHKQAPKAT